MSPPGEREARLTGYLFSEGRDYAGKSTVATVTVISIDCWERTVIWGLRIPHTAFFPLPALSAQSKKWKSTVEQSQHNNSLLERELSPKFLLPSVKDSSCKVL